MGKRNDVARLMLMNAIARNAETESEPVSAPESTPPDGYPEASPAPTWTEKDARLVGEYIGIKWASSPFPPSELLKGMYVELEHGSRWPECNVTGDDPSLTARIAWAHLRESPDYYVYLEEMEKRF